MNSSPEAQPGPADRVAIGQEGCWGRAAAGGERVHLALYLEPAFRVGGALADWQRKTTCIEAAGSVWGGPVC